MSLKNISYVIDALGYEPCRVSEQRLNYLKTLEPLGERRPQQFPDRKVSSLCLSFSLWEKQETSCDKLLQYRTALSLFPSNNRRTIRF